jgi:hypothetical protein
MSFAASPKTPIAREIFLTVCSPRSAKDSVFGREGGGLAGYMKSASNAPHETEGAL